MPTVPFVTQFFHTTQGHKSVFSALQHRFSGWKDGVQLIPIWSLNQGSMKMLQNTQPPVVLLDFPFVTTKISELRKILPATRFVALGMYAGHTDAGWFTDDFIAENRPDSIVFVEPHRQLGAADPFVESLNYYLPRRDFEIYRAHGVTMEVDWVPLIRPDLLTEELRPVPDHILDAWGLYTAGYAGRQLRSLLVYPTGDEVEQHSMLERAQSLCRTANRAWHVIDGRWLTDRAALCARLAHGILCATGYSMVWELAWQGVFHKDCVQMIILDRPLENMRDRITAALEFSAARAHGASHLSWDASTLNDALTAGGVLGRRLLSNDDQNV